MRRLHTAALTSAVVLSCLIAVAPVGAAGADTASPRIATRGGADPTLELRDLGMELNASTRAPADSDIAQFQRPWDDSDIRQTTISTGNIALHYLSTATPANTGNQHAATPAWAQTSADVLGAISTAYVQAGYRLPKADSATENNPFSPHNGEAVNWGGSAQTDVYLTDLGNQGIYGYCAYDLDDDGRLVHVPEKSDIPAFCVLDNDYSPAQFRATYAGETPTDILKVTAAHEYFHAVQFAYDALEDSWFMEATATWAEHQIYPQIPDNTQYLPYSQIRRPQLPLDSWENGGSYQYGSWIFFEYLTERIPDLTGPMPNLVLAMWQQADSLGPDRYSMDSVDAALAGRGRDLTKLFADYAASNLRAASVYQNGSSYPVTTPARLGNLRTHRTMSGVANIDHLASTTIRFRPSKIKSARARARISVDLADRDLDTAAILTIVRTSGAPLVRQIKLNAHGNGAVRVPFSTKRVVRVDLTLVNANRSYGSCSANRQGYSCGGTPRHDALVSRWNIRT